MHVLRGDWLLSREPIADRGDALMLRAESCDDGLLARDLQSWCAAGLSCERRSSFCMRRSSAGCWRGRLAALLSKRDAPVTKTTLRIEDFLSN